ncbi:hypothetical protein AAAC51_20990 [Priestia megaterium]
MMSVKTIYDIVANMKEQLHVELSHPYVKNIFIIRVLMKIDYCTCVRS